MRGLILTAGEGSRLKEICGCRSKCMLPFNGKPLITRHLDRLSSIDEIDKIHIIVHKDERDIQKHFGNEYRGVPLTYHVQHDMENGLVGAIYSVDDLSFYDKSVLLMLGDEFTGDFDIKDFITQFRHNDNAALVLAIPTEDEEKIKKNYTLKTDIEGKIINAQEKPDKVMSNLIGTGIAAFPSHALEKFAITCFSPGKRNYNLTDLIMFTPGSKAYVKKVDYCNINKPDDYAGLYTRESVKPQDISLVEAFRTTASVNRTRTALICKDGKLDYGRLDQLSDEIARGIIYGNYPAGSCIAIMCSRTIEHFVLMMGILKAGCYYLPLDDKLPEERLKYMVEKANAAAIISMRSISACQIAFKCPVIFYEDLLELGQRENISAISRKDLTEIIPSPFAYIIFTSGSTGRPKGVKIKQTSLLNFSKTIENEIFTMADKPHVEAGVIASFSFDLSVQQIFPALLGGHTLHVISEDVKKRPSSLEKEISTLDVCDATPLIMELIAKHLRKAGRTGSGPRVLLSGGEEMKPSVAGDFLSAVPGCKLFNCYGPTECTVQTTIFPVDIKEISKDSHIPVGKPIKNTRVYILDKENKILPPGEKGRIWIAGLGVSAGYEDEKEMTDKAFCRDILFNDQTMYDSGDMGYWDHNGNLCCCGREDDQIKYKGYRIEPGEIERILEKTKDIKMCKVLLITDEKKDGYDRQSLTAFYTTNSGKDNRAEELRRILARHLPPYMIPQYFIRVEKFALNHNGKIDKEALITENRAYNHRHVSGDNMDEISGGVYDCIIKVWEDNIDDRPLASQGLDSLDMICILTEIEEKFSVKLDVSDWTPSLTFREITEKVRRTVEQPDKPVYGQPASACRRPVQVLPMQKYLAELEDMVCGGAAGNYRMFNQMIYFLPAEPDIDIESLSKSFAQIQQRHDAFSLGFEKTGSRLYISPHTNCKVKDIIVIRGGEAEKIINTCGRAPVSPDMASGSYIMQLVKDMRWNSNELCKLVCFCGKERSLLMLCVHHLIFDYYSLLQFMEELEAGYRASLPEQKKDALISYMTSYAKFTHDDSVRQQSGFWHTYLDGSVCTDLESYKTANDNCTEEIASEIHIASLTDGNGTSRHLHYMVSPEKILALRRFCQKTGIGEFAALMGLMLNLTQNQEKQALLFYTNGRSRLKPVNAIGFFSFLLPYVADENIKHAETFEQKTLALEKKLAGLRAAEHGFEKMNDNKLKETLISGSGIFDYQKLYSRKKEAVWKKFLPYEFIGVYNPFTFRIFDYGDEAEISVMYDNSKMADEKMINFVGDYLYMWDIFLCQNDKI